MYLKLELLNLQRHYALLKHVENTSINAAVAPARLEGRLNRLVQLTTVLMAKSHAVLAMVHFMCADRTTSSNDTLQQYDKQALVPYQVVIRLAMADNTSWVPIHTVLDQGLLLPLETASAKLQVRNCKCELQAKRSADTANCELLTGCDQDS